MGHMERGPAGGEVVCHGVKWESDTHRDGRRVFRDKCGVCVCVCVSVSVCVGGVTCRRADVSRGGAERSGAELLLSPFLLLDPGERARVTEREGRRKGEVGERLGEREREI